MKLYGKIKNIFNNILKALFGETYKNSGLKL